MVVYCVDKITTRMSSRVCKSKHCKLFTSSFHITQTGRGIGKIGGEKENMINGYNCICKKKQGYACPKLANRLNNDFVLMA